jgi:tetratricopeptide (TPR) repeat protein
MLHKGWMKTVCLGASVLWVCAAQSNPPTAAEIEKAQAGLMADLRGQAENAGGKLPELPKDQAPAGLVSVAQLRHKPRKSAQKHLSRGFDFHKTGDPSRAAAEYEKAIAEDPQLADGYVGAGVEYTALQRYEEAEAMFRRGISLNPCDWGARQDLGILLYTTGDLDAAEINARRALDLSRGDDRAHYLLGVLLLRRQESRADGLQHLQLAARSLPEAKQILQGLRGLSSN